MTMLIRWEPNMSVGVAILDEDHKRIMRMINKLYAAMLEGKGKEVLADILHDLTVYINIHFEAEEGYFELTGYPGAAEQRRQHQDMIRKTMEAKQKFKENESSVSPLEVMDFLKDWWIDHIMNSDRKYAEHLNKHGIR